MAYRRSITARAKLLYEQRQRVTPSFSYIHRDDDERITLSDVPIRGIEISGTFCYWITSNLFSLTYGLVIRIPEVKKLLGIPIIPLAPPSSTDQKPAFSFFEALKKYAAAQQQQSLLSSPGEASKPTTPRIPSSAVLNQRLKSLEKEVKGRKRGTKGDNMNFPSPLCR